MKAIILSILMLLPGAAQARDFLLSVGEATLLTAGPSSTVRIGSRKIVRTVEETRGIRVIAMKPGETTIVVDGTVHRIVVSGTDQKSFYLELRERFKQRMGLHVEILEGHVTVTGQLLRFDDWLEIAQLARHRQATYRFHARPIPDVAHEALVHFQKVSERERWPKFRLNSEPYMTAELPAGTKSLKTQAERYLQPFGIDVVIDQSQVEVQPLIRTRVILAEVSKDFSQDLGIEWPSAYQAQIVPGWKSPSEILLNLRAMESKGRGKVLAAPNLTCRSGSQAEFHAGGEFPIKIFSRTTHDVVWKKHGVILNVKPKADFKGTISLDIETEISLLDASAAVDGIPALKTNRVKSHFDIVGSKTIALSGLIRQDWGENRQGIAGLSGLPIIGALFGSQKFLNHQTELVIFVTPEITSPDSDDQIKMPEGWSNESI